MTVLTPPASFKYASVTMSLKRAVARTISPFTFDEQSFVWPGEQWSAEVELPTVGDDELAGEWRAFLLKLRGSSGLFYLGNVARPTPMGVATGTPLVNGALQTGNTLVTDGWTNSVNGILKAGDFIQLGTGSSSRLYMITADANSDGSGNATLSITPALRSSPANNAAIVVTNPVGVFRLSSNDTSWSVQPGRLYRMSFTAVEVVNA